MKMCIVSREMYPRDTMLRFVKSPDNKVVFDVAEKLPGEGMWVYANRQLNDIALNKHAFHKMVGGYIGVDSDFMEKAYISLKNRCINILSLARKAGYIVYGFENVKKSLEKQEVFIAFEATDSSPGGQSKLYKASDTFTICHALSREELGQITGAGAQVHVVVLKSKLAQELHYLATKLNLLDTNKKG